MVEEPRARGHRCAGRWRTARGSSPAVAGETVDLSPAPHGPRRAPQPGAGSPGCRTPGPPSRTRRRPDRRRDDAAGGERLGPQDRPADLADHALGHRHRRDRQAADQVAAWLARSADASALPATTAPTNSRAVRLGSPSSASTATVGVDGPADAVPDPLERRLGRARRAPARPRDVAGGDRSDGRSLTAPARPRARRRWSGGPRSVRRRRGTARWCGRATWPRSRRPPRAGGGSSCRRSRTAAGSG